MNYKQAFEEARNFVGADWEHMKPDSRALLLEREGYDHTMAVARWAQIPETVRVKLVKRVIRSKR